MTIDNYSFQGKKAIARVDFNVPLDDKGQITDDTRIRGALPTLQKILTDGGALILMSHMGKPKGKVSDKLSLKQIVPALSQALGRPVLFAPDCAKAQEQAAALKAGEVLLLENLRFYPEEEGKPIGIDKIDPAYEEAKKAMKSKQKEFAKTLASYADCYVNDAFGTAHRKHASTAVIADYFDADHSGKRSEQYQPSFHCYYGRLESEHQDRNHNQPAEQGGQPDYLRRNDLYVREGYGRQDRYIHL